LIEKSFYAPSKTENLGQKQFRQIVLKQKNHQQKKAGGGKKLKQRLNLV